MSVTSSDPSASKRAKRNEYLAVWRAFNKDKVDSYQAKYREANRDTILEKQRERSKLLMPVRLAAKADRKVLRVRAAPDPEKARLAWLKRDARPEVKEARRKYDAGRRAELLAKAQQPENKAKRNARLRAYYQTPKGNLHRRMSVAIRGSLKRSGKAATWPALVGYSVDELRQHLERQFVRGMGWHNISEWHIDHIVPLSSFAFATADDPEFKVAWALANLRPLWGSENIRKNAKREYLL
jgi:hypothetical protein